MVHSSNNLWGDDPIPLENCVLPLDSSARELRTGSRMTIEECSCCIWRLEKEGKPQAEHHAYEDMTYVRVPFSHGCYVLRQAWRRATSGIFRAAVYRSAPYNFCK